MGGARTTISRHWKQRSCRPLPVHRCMGRSGGDGSVGDPAQGCTPSLSPDLTKP